MKHTYFRVVFLAVLASSFIAVNPVEAQSRNGWYRAGCNKQGECTYVKKIGGSWPFIKFKSNGSTGMDTREADCQQWRYRFLGDHYPSGKSPWAEVMPGSVGEGVIKTACR